MSSWSEPRVAVVTGGASGIGLAISERLARDGAAVAVLDVNGPAATTAAAGIEAQGGRAVGIEADVTDRARVEEAVSDVAGTLGPPLILVNNAGRDSFMPFLEIDLEHWNRTLEINLTGTFHCCQVVLPHMIGARWGRIVNISSSSTHSGTPRMAAYVSAKSAVIGLTKCLALEFARKGVTVNTIPPGFIDTPMLRAADAAGRLDIEAATKMTPVGTRGTTRRTSRRLVLSLQGRSELCHRPGDRGERREEDLSRPLPLAQVLRIETAAVPGARTAGRSRPGGRRAPGVRPPGPRSCSTSSWTWRSPEAPTGSPLAMSPPSVLTGSGPSISVAPSDDQLLLLAVGAEAVLGHVDDLCSRIGVLQLDDVDVLGTDARCLVRRHGTRRRWARGPPRRLPRCCAPHTPRSAGCEARSPGGGPGAEV